MNAANRAALRQAACACCLHSQAQRPRIAIARGGAPWAAGLRLSAGRRHLNGACVKAIRAKAGSCVALACYS